jgi:hypothetical protein
VGHHDPRLVSGPRAPDVPSRGQALSGGSIFDFDFDFDFDLI